MTTHLVDFMIPDNFTLLQAVEKIQRNGSRAVLVMKSDVVVGVVSEGDVMRALLRGVDVHTPLVELAHRSFKYLQNQDPRAAFEIFQKHAISLIPVVDQDFRLTDIITLPQLLKQVVLP